MSPYEPPTAEPLEPPRDQLRCRRVVWGYWIGLLLMITHFPGWLALEALLGESRYSLALVTVGMTGALLVAWTGYKLDNARAGVTSAVPEAEFRFQASGQDETERASYTLRREATVRDHPYQKSAV